MEACAFVGATIPRIVARPASAHYRARELAKGSREVRLMPPNYAKPDVKRGKTYAIDAEAICEGLKPLAQRSVDPGDRFPGDCPGIGSVTASALAASAPDVSNFKAARDLSASG